MKKKQPQAATTTYRKAITLDPSLPEVHFGLGNALHANGKINEAIAAFGEALRLDPHHADCLNNLGNALRDEGRLDDAIAAYQRTILLRSDFAGARNNLANVLLEKGRPDEAIAVLQHVIQYHPEYADAHYNLGNALKDTGQLDEAINCYRRSMALQPNDPSPHSNLVYTLSFHPGYDARAILEECRRWAERYGRPLAAQIQPHHNDRSPDRQLRIGYVSPDFYSHAVGQFLLPLFEFHDHQQFEIFAYSSVRKPDHLTARLRHSADVWRDIVGQTDEQLADTIHADQIDILIDLTMHMAHNRLLLFARKPAPIQMTYLAYCGTTGLDAIDYRLSDPYLDPADEPMYYSEQTLRLPHTYWCYPKDPASPPINPLPALQSGYITFGCLNNFCKVSPGVLDCWGRLLKQVEGSKLILHAKPGEHRERILRLMQDKGVSPSRITFVGMLSWEDYLAQYENIDIALDPFPCGGGTTTCDALWMGVPVVSLAGQTAVGRGGLSILTNIGLPELVAKTPDDYVRLAAACAQDLPRLAELRNTMRKRMLNSPLMDPSQFTRDMEKLFRQAWRQWCDSPH